ncbi:MipA/OmpV family protein [Sphingomonas sp.]|uniref:MipA/OmpV family protein n=1 Tax=Sphingomonas sp. TaxID=28214 RepID=UPI00286E2143|nr:MipA/OmpV family protein [Sphingomonas sp.]
MRQFRFLAAAAAVSLAATPAFAQDSDATLPDDEQAGATTIGLGAAFVPDYEGSDDYRLVPGGVLRTKIGSVSIQTRGLAVYADLIDGGSDGVDLDLGPILAVRLNRTGKIKDNVVDELPDRNAAIEVGGFAGVGFKGLTNPYDRLSLRLDAVKDIGSAHQSLVLSPSVDFTTPLSKTFFMGASLSADFVADRYADYYFSVTPSGALASGLPVFDADGGMKNWKVGLLANQSLSGDLRRGWSLFGTTSYSRLVGDFKRSPIVSRRGSAGQWMGAVGVGYTF